MRTIRTWLLRVIYQTSMVTTNCNALISEYVDVSAFLSEKNMRICHNVTAKLTDEADFPISFSCANSSKEIYGPTLMRCFI